MKKMPDFAPVLSLILLLGLLLTGCLGSSAEPLPSAALTPGSDWIPFADLIADPGSFDGLRLCTSGIYVSGFEASNLGAGTLKRAGLTYLEEPAIWIEGGEFTSRQGCFTDGAGPQRYEFCQVTVCGRFERCQGCGAGNGAAFQIVGPSLPDPIPGSSAAAPRVDPTPSGNPAPVEVTVLGTPGPAYEVVFTIPVGEGGVQYRGVGVLEMQVTGPTALAVLADRTFVIGDLIDNQLLRYSAQGELLNTIDLYSLDIVNVSDLQAAGNLLFLKEISGYHVAPSRSRLHRLSPDGELLGSFDIPPEYRLADNLPGIMVDGEGRIVLEAEGRVQQLVDPEGNWAIGPTEGLAYYGRWYRADNFGEVPRIFTADIVLETRLTEGLGGLQILGALPDGRFYALRDDLLSDPQGITVDQTIHLVDAQGTTMGVGRYPLREAFYHVERHLALGPEGSVYGLLPAEKTLQIIRLHFYTHLEPLTPGAARPRVSVAANP